VEAGKFLLKLHKTCQLSPLSKVSVAMTKQLDGVDVVIGNE